MAVPDSVIQEIQVDDQYAVGTAKIRWRAIKGQLLPFLSEPAVLTRVTIPADALKLVQTPWQAGTPANPGAGGRAV